MQQKECVAMLLAGGQGSRLGTLTKKIAKPAVPFGGRYRLIDFTLSNCNNSGIDTIGVLTQYKPLLLNSYLGIGSAWDLDVRDGGVFVLPPFVGEKGGTWYKGTANAIYQNRDFLEYYNPKYVLVLSGDHIYKMDYSLMLDYHKTKKAQVTISVIQVPFAEANRFGIMNTDTEGRVIEFAEKPQQPKSNLASMGIYIFDWLVLREYLEMDEQDPDSDNDFGKNVIPQTLRSGVNVYAYSFQGYWKDVGTIESYYEANMDLLQESPQLDIFDDRLKLFSKPPILPPHYLGEKAVIRNSLIPDGCLVLGEVENSILFPGVYIGQEARIRDSIIMPNAEIGDYSIISKAIIGEKTVISDYCYIGVNGVNVNKAADITVIGDGIVFPEGIKIEKGSVINSWHQSETKIC
ncbi:MAG: glucose-1-phosphate adenylyltransferase [Peptococcaceae bacterium]